MISWRTIGAAASLALVLWAFWGTYEHGRSTMDAEWKARWAVRDAGDKQAWAQEESRARSEEQRRAAAQEEARANARKQEHIAAAGADGADDAGQRLHDDAARYAAAAGKCTADSAAAARGQAATRAAMVLSDLLTRADARAGELAKAYDRARIAGFACEATYTALIK
ncbi:DUF2514 family protein [Pseudomonas donghuensis]|uniref:DUF2514 family protein n=1 Tax=Pseudomonas donghuensis TaxID=1163398 RepID=UPI00029A2CCC|nr:DUF2514 family protein [Pseudomonas donghuensis]UVL26861.1 DUF2514 domain-containing protein [Pseudomonas donghuensis]UVL31850.1 DUF2514 domain-containing protein [Pseudomonas donghuensis]